MADAFVQTQVGGATVTRNIRSGDFEISIDGITEMRARLFQLAEQMPQRLAAATFEVAEDIMTVAKARTPVDLGNLRDTGHVQAPIVEPQSITIVMGFGGPAVDYAIYVHEDLNARHTVGQAKFLESALLDRVPTLASSIAARVF